MARLFNVWLLHTSREGSALDFRLPPGNVTSDTRRSLGSLPPTPHRLSPVSFASLHLDYILNQTELLDLTPTALTGGRYSLLGDVGRQPPPPRLGLCSTLHLPAPTIRPPPTPAILGLQWQVWPQFPPLTGLSCVWKLLKPSRPPGFVPRWAHGFDFLIGGSRKPLLIKGSEKGKGYPRE